MSPVTAPDFYLLLEQRGSGGGREGGKQAGERDWTQISEIVSGGAEMNLADVSLLLRT